MSWELIAGMAIAALLLLFVVKAYGKSREREGRSDVANEQAQEGVDAEKRADEVRSRGRPGAAELLKRLRLRKKRRSGGT